VVDREYDDLATVIDAAGGSALLYGTSGGAVIALRQPPAGLPAEGWPCDAVARGVPDARRLTLQGSPTTPTPPPSPRR
jgi:hypothetical protein